METHVREKIQEFVEANDSQKIVCN